MAGSSSPSRARMDGQHVGRHHLAGGDAHRASNFFGRARREPREGRRLFAHGPRALEQRRTPVCQFVATPTAPEQHHAERGLQLCDVAAERRLAGADPSGSGGKAAGPGHRREAADKIPVEFRHGSLFKNE